jgi:hypothetical protein
MKRSLVSYIILLFLLSCRPQSSKNEISNVDSKKEHKPVIKPPTIFSDTLKIDSKAAVFYYPDSLQLEGIKAKLDTLTFDAIMHEYFYQFRYIHNVLNDFRPRINIVEARNVRYLLFIKADKSNEIIDLDTKYDPYGLFVFDPQKNPSQLELTNAGSEIGFYFADIGKPGASN